jgi:hypothetical protein
MMFFVLVLLLSVIPLNGLALWAFVRFSPAPPEHRPQNIYNTTTFILAPAVCAFFSFWVHARLMDRVDEKWLPFFAALAWPAAFPLILVLAGLVRFLLFGKLPDSSSRPRRPSVY